MLAHKSAGMEAISKAVQLQKTAAANANNTLRPAVQLHACHACSVPLLPPPPCTRLDVRGELGGGRGIDGGQGSSHVGQVASHALVHERSVQVVHSGDGVVPSGLQVRIRGAWAGRDACCARGAGCCHAQVGCNTMQHSVASSPVSAPQRP